MITLDRELTAQLFGVIALVISLIVFQINDRRKMLNTGALAAVFWTIHFYLLGAATGAALNAVGGVRDVTLAHTKPTRQNLWILVAVIILASFATAVTWQGWYSILPLIACALNGLSFWTNNTTRIRRLFLLVPPLWFVYNFINHSYPGMAIECLVLLSNLLGQYRFDLPLLRRARARG